MPCEIGTPLNIGQRFKTSPKGEHHAQIRM